MSWDGDVDEHHGASTDDGDSNRVMMTMMITHVSAIDDEREK